MRLEPLTFILEPLSIILKPDARRLMPIFDTWNVGEAAD
jgi:hypothetical protein